MLVDFSGRQLSVEASSETLVHTYVFSSPEVLLVSEIDVVLDVVVHGSHGC